MNKIFTRQNKQLTPIFFAFLLFAFGLSNNAQAQTAFTATYTLIGDGNNVAALPYNGAPQMGIDVGDLLKVGITSTSSSGNFRGNDWPTANAVDTGKYIQLNIEANNGFEFEISEVNFGVGHSSTGPSVFEWRGSHNAFVAPIDNYTSLNSGVSNSSGILTTPSTNSSWTNNVLNLSSIYQNQTGNVVLRIYGYNASSSGGTGGLQGNLTITGFYSLAGVTNPEPSNHVTALSAGNVFDIAADISWIDSDTSNNAAPALGYLIVGERGSSSHTAPVDGTPISNDFSWNNGLAYFNVADIGGNNGYTFTNLDAQTNYNFFVYPYSNTGVNIDYKTSATVPNISITTLGAPDTILYESFTTDPTSGSMWSIYNGGGATTWSHNAAGLMRMNAFSNSCNANDWLITGPIDMDSYVSKRFNIEVARGFSGNDLYMLYSNNFVGGNPDSAAYTWDTIQVFTNSATLFSQSSITSATGTNGYIAFVYKPATTSCAQWDVVDFLLVGDQQTVILPCDAPDSISVSNVSQTIANLTWNGGSAISWEVEFGPSGFAQGSGTGTIVSTNSASYTFNGLSPSTTYDVYVSGICANNSSMFVGPVSFTTASPTVTCPTPANVNVDASVIDSIVISWTSGGSPIAVLQIAEFVQGSPSFTQASQTITTSSNPYVYTGAMPNTDYVLLVQDSCPGLGLSQEVGPIAFSTASYTCQNPTNLQAGNIAFTSAEISWIQASNNLSIDLEFGPSGFNQGSGTLMSNVSTPYSLSGLNHSTSYDVYIVGNCNFGTQSMVVGPITFSTDTPSCTGATQIAASFITTSGADITWTSGSNVDSTYLEYGVSGFTQGTGIVLNNVTSPVVLSGLTDDTNYDVYVTEYCQFGLSNTATPITFQTDTIVILNGLSDLIISEYGEGLSNNKWIEIFNGTGADVDLTPYVIATYANGATTPSNELDLSGTLPNNSVFVVANNGSVAQVLNLADTTHPVTFFNGDDAIALLKNNLLIDVLGEIGQRPTPGWSVGGVTAATVDHTLVRKATVCSPNSNWSQSAGTTAANSEWLVYPANDFSHIGFHIQACVTLTSCDAPSNISVSNVSSTAATISWTSGGSTIWNVEYGISGFTPGTGTFLTTGSNPLNLNLLDPATSYDVYVQDSCFSIGTSAWEGPINFSTASAAPVPVYPIGLINQVNANGVLDSNGVYCSIIGIVHSSDHGTPPSNAFSLFDSTGAFSVFKSGGFNPPYTVTLGDEIQLWGTLGDFNGLGQILPDSMKVISSGNIVPEPEIVTSLGEFTESRLIKVEHVRLASPGNWPTPGVSRNLVLILPDGSTIEMRIHGRSGVVDTYPNAPSGTFSVTGIGGQFMSSIPKLGGYQLIPRFADDIDTTKPASPSIFINEVMTNNTSTTQDNAGDFDNWIEIYNDEDEVVNLGGMFISNSFFLKTFHQFERNNADLNIPAKGYILLWADDEVNQGSSHLPFTFTNMGDEVILSNIDGNTIDSIAIPVLDADVSYGRESNAASNWIEFTTATPNAANVTTSLNKLTYTNDDFIIFPNPSTAKAIYTNKVVSGSIYNLLGARVSTFENSRKINIEGFTPGIYLVKTSNGETQKLIVK